MLRCFLFVFPVLRHTSHVNRIPVPSLFPNTLDLIGELFPLFKSSLSTWCALVLIRCSDDVNGLFMALGKQRDLAKSRYLDAVELREAPALMMQVTLFPVQSSWTDGKRDYG